LPEAPAVTPCVIFYVSNRLLTACELLRMKITASTSITARCSAESLITPRLL
jgi:hypothetical protein